MCVTRCRSKSSLSSANAQWPIFFSRSCLCTSTTTTPKKRGIGKKLLLTIRATVQEEHMDLVAGDFNGAAWRQSNGNNSQPTSILEEAFADTDFPMPPGPPPLWCPGAVPGELTDVCGFVRFPNSYDTWKVRPHGAFTIPLELPEPSSKRPKLPPRGMATLGPCQQSICSRATRTPRATCPPQGKILLLPAKQRDRQVRR